MIASPISIKHGPPLLHSDLLSLWPLLPLLPSPAAPSYVQMAATLGHARSTQGQKAVQGALEAVAAWGHTRAARDCRCSGP